VCKREEGGAQREEGGVKIGAQLAGLTQEKNVESQCLSTFSKQNSLHENKK
jgi:hypothetical protein